MKERLEQIIQYATHGNVQRFADSVGWSRQYVANVLSGRRGVGLLPVQKILQAYPDISARWLVIGEGQMLRSASDTMLECVCEVLLHEYNTTGAKDFARTMRMMERLTSRLASENSTKTAP